MTGTEDYTTNATILYALFAAFMVSLAVCELLEHGCRRMLVWLGLERWMERLDRFVYRGEL